MHRVVHFEVHAENPERAIAFYSGLFGWKFDKFEGGMEYWLITTGAEGEPGINGGLLRRMGPNPPPADPTPVIAFVCTIDVPDIEKAMADAVKAGGTPAVPKQPITGMAWLAYMKDTESNLFGLYQLDSNAR